jgi:hypothetical protein
MDADVQHLLQNTDTDHKGHLAFHVRKPYSSPATCDKCIQTDLQIVCKSATMFKNADTDKDWPMKHVEMHVRDSASVTSVRVWEEKLYFWHNFKLQILILFQTLEQARSSLFVMFRIPCSVCTKYLKVAECKVFCTESIKTCNADVHSTSSLLLPHSICKGSEGLLVISSFKL